MAQPTGSLQDREFAAFIADSEDGLANKRVEVMNVGGANGSASEATLQQILLAVDGLEGFTDNLESLATTTNTLLTTIKDNADQLEGFLDGVETLISSSNTTLSSIDAGTPAGLGQTTMANSQPTVLASDHTDIPTKTKDGVGTIITSSSLNSGTNIKQGLDVVSLAPSFDRYCAPVFIRQTAASAANTTVWSMRNSSGSTKTIFIDRIMLSMEFNAATPVNRTLLQYVFNRFTTATPTGGTALTAGKLDSDSSASQVTDIRFLDTGLTTTGVVFDSNALGAVGCPSFGTFGTTYIREGMAIKLNAGEGLAIRLRAAAVIGQELSGEILWSER